MATPKNDIVSDIDWDALSETLGNIRPKVDYSKPRQVGKREVEKAPGVRRWTEVWYHPSTHRSGNDDFIETGYYHTHIGTDFIWTAEFWEEVEMLTSETSTIDEIRRQMGHLDDEAIAEAHAHYVDKYTWEDGSERVRNLMLAFEAERREPSGKRVFHKIRDMMGTTKQNLYTEFGYDILKTINNSMELTIA